MSCHAGLSESFRTFASGGFFCLLIIFASLSAQGTTPTTAGIWKSNEAERRLSDARIKELVQSLRRITGLSGLDFNSNGALTLGEASATNGGSAFARQILYCVLGSGDAFIIEDHSKSLSVNFGQLDEGMSYENVMADRKLEIWRVRIDFEDFREMEAPKEVRATFDIGFILLHELLHGLGLKDTSQEEEVGECEEAVNQARADLGLPVRDQYLGETLKISQYHVSLRLRFRSSMKEEQGKARYLFFLLPPGYTSLKCMR